MKKTKTSKGKTSKEKKIFEKFLTLLGFVFERVSKHGEVWKHHVKKLSTQIPTSPSASQWVNDYKRQLSKLISPAFSREELELLLQPLIKKRKVQFTKDGRMRLLRTEGDLELNMLRDLLIDDMSINQELQEFSDGKDDDEMDDLYEKVKDISFKVLKKDKRKTKIEDEEN